MFAFLPFWCVLLIIFFLRFVAVSFANFITPKIYS